MRIHAEHVVQDEHLRIAVRARADADGENRKFLGQFARDLEIDDFEHDRVGAGRFDGERVFDQPIAMRAHAIAGANAGGLRRDADVADDGNTGARDRADARGFFAAALEFDAGRAAFFDQANRVAQRVFVADLKRTEGHVADDVRARCAADDGGGVMDHHVDRHGRRFIESEHDVAQTITAENPVDAGFFGVAREGCVVRGDHWDGSCALAALDRASGDAS